ncbi:MAG: MFS transporter [Candidatus Aenigmarchaeota archaeon]|nr:MFS transporter [Candidatus Aenigmarchaeota archaeon]
MGNKIIENRVIFGGTLGFFKSVLTGFSMMLLPMYFSMLNISLVSYALLLTIGDAIAFLIKPIIGHFSDKHGEKIFLIGGIILYTFSLFLIGQTTSVFNIALLQVIAGISSAFLLSIIIIFALRNVQKKPDRAVGLFGAIQSAGWIFGLLLPGFIIDRVGIKTVFYLCPVLGIVLSLLVLKVKTKIKPSKFSFSFVKKIPLPLIYKTIDMAVFNAFLIFFIRYALKILALSKSMISMIVAFECLVFAVSEYGLSRISNKQKRKQWIPIGMMIHGLGIATMLFGSSLSHYFVAAGLIGFAGAFIDIWVYSYISEKVGIKDKGKTIGTVEWSRELGTIFGAQVPMWFSFLAVNPFASIFVFPFIGLVTHLIKKN